MTKKQAITSMINGEIGYIQWTIGVDDENFAYGSAAWDDGSLRQWTHSPSRQGQTQAKQFTVDDSDRDKREILDMIIPADAVIRRVK